MHVVSVRDTRLDDQGEVLRRQAAATGHGRARRAARAGLARILTLTRTLDAIGFMSGDAVSHPAATLVVTPSSDDHETSVDLCPHLLTSAGRVSSRVHAKKSLELLQRRFRVMAPRLLLHQATPLFRVLRKNNDPTSCAGGSKLPACLVRIVQPRFASFNNCWKSSGGSASHTSGVRMIGCSNEMRQA